MKNQRKKHKPGRKQRFAELLRKATEIRLPEGAVMADLSEQVPIQSCVGPPAYYVDRPFVCRDCGSEEVWKAKDQKWFYEVAKGSLHQQATRCLACRRARKNAGRRGDPNRIKSVGGMLKLLRVSIEPAIDAAGFVFQGRREDEASRSSSNEYRRGDELFQCRYDRRPSLSEVLLVGEYLDAAGKTTLVAQLAPGPKASPPLFLAHMGKFAADIRKFLHELPPPEGTAPSELPRAAAPRQTPPGPVD